MRDILVTGGGDATGARTTYISYSKLTANEGEQRMLFSDEENNLSAYAAANVLSGGKEKPEDGDCFELIISTDPKDFDKLGHTVEECKENYTAAIRAGLSKMFAGLGIENVRYVGGIHLNTFNPHAHVVIHKGAQNSETGEPVILEELPRSWFYKGAFENSKLGQYFDAEVARRVVASPPEMLGVIPDENIFLPAPEDDHSERALKAFESFAERNNVKFNQLERLQDENILYVNRQGGLTFVKRNAQGNVTGHTNETGWTGKDTNGLFFVGNPQKATRFTFVQSPKDLIALLELVSSRDLSENCFISCNGNSVPEEAIELVKAQSLQRSTRIIWAFNLDRQGNQEARSFDKFQEDILNVHKPETPNIEFHRYAPRPQYGKTWKDQLYYRNLPGEIAALMKSEFIFKKTATVNDELVEEQIDKSYLTDIYNRVQITEDNGEFIVYQKPLNDASDEPLTEFGRYKWQLTDTGSIFTVTSIAGDAVSSENDLVVADDEADLISQIEDIYIAQMEQRYIQELSLESQAEIEAVQSAPETEEVSQKLSPMPVAKSTEVLRQEAYDRAKALTAELNKIRLEEVLNLLGLNLYDRGEKVYEDAAGNYKIHLKTVDKGQVWNDRKDGMRGGLNAISLVSHVLNTDFDGAKEWMKGYFGSDYIAPPAPIRPEITERADEKRELKLPYEYTKHLPTVVDYLVNKRGISQQLVNAEINRGKIYANYYKSAVFLHRDEDLNVTGASWRATVGNKRQDVAGSDKNKGWYHIGNLQDAKRFVLTEAPIEALSYVELHPEINLNETVVIAASGNNITQGLRRHIEKQGADGEIVLAFNNDDGGETGVLNALEKLDLFVQFRHKRSYIESGKADEPDNGYTGKVTVELPPNAQDWNDALLELRDGSKYSNQGEHVADEISVIEESLAHQETNFQEEETQTLEAVEAENFQPEVSIEQPIEINVEAVAIDDQEIDNILENIETDFPESAIRTTNIRLTSEDARLGKFELLFARNPDSSENTGFTGYRITVYGENGYVIENLPNRRGDEAKIGKPAMRQSLSELITEVKERIKFQPIRYNDYVKQYEDIRFLARGLNETEVFARKVAGMYELPSTFAIRPEFDKAEKAIIKEWSDLTSPTKFYAAEDVFTKTYFRNFAKRAVIQDLIHRGYVQIELSDKGIVQIKGGNPLLPEALEVYSESENLAADTELRVEREPETINVPVENHLNEIARTINSEIRKINADLSVEVRKDANDTDVYYVQDSAGDELFKINAPDYSAEGWTISRPIGDYDGENDGYVEVATVEYGFEIADAVGEIMNLPVKEESESVAVVEKPITKYRNLTTENVYKENRKNNIYYESSLNGIITKTTKYNVGRGEIYLGFHFIAENGVTYQQKFRDNSVEGEIYKAIQDGTIRTGDAISFYGQINEQQESGRLRGKGRAAVAVYASKIDHQPGDGQSPVENAVTESFDEIPEIISEIVPAEPIQEINEIPAAAEIIVSEENAVVEIPEQVGETEKAEESEYQMPESRFVEITPVGELETKIADFSVTVEYFTTNGAAVTSNATGFQVWDEKGGFLETYPTIAEAVERVGDQSGEFYNIPADYELRIIPQMHHTYAVFDRNSQEKAKTYTFAEVLAANQEQTYIAPEKPEVVKEKSVTVEWKPRQVKVEDLYGFGFKGNQAKAMEVQMNLSRNSAELLNILDTHFGGKLTEEAENKLEPLVNAIYNGCCQIAIDPRSARIDEIARRFAKQVKSDGETIVEIVPQIVETELEKTLREFNEILQAEPATQNYVCEVDEDETEANDFLTLGIREKNTSLPLYTVAPPDYGEEYYRITELVTIPATKDTPSDVEYTHVGNYFSIEDAGKALTDGVKKLYEAAESEILIEAQIDQADMVLAETDPELEQIIQEHVNQTSDELAEIIAGDADLYALNEKDLAVDESPVKWLEIEDYELNEETDRYFVGETKNFNIESSTNGLYFIFKDSKNQKIQEKSLDTPIIVNVEGDNFNRVHINGIAEPLKNRRYGREIYQALAEKFGIISTSSASSSEDVQHLWNSLINSNQYHWANLEYFTAIATDREKLDKFIEAKKEAFAEEPKIITGEPVRFEYQVADGQIERRDEQNLTANLPEENIEKIFQVTAGDEDHEAGKNYRWTDAELHHAGSKKRFQWNMEALELLRKLEEESRLPETAEEKETLARFSGWGSMKGVFNAYTEDSKTWEKERQQAANMLTNEEFAAASNATLNSHFTDGKIVDTAWQIADRLGFAGGRVIEPSVGNGIYIGRIPDFLKDKTHFTAIEKESIAARISRKLYPESKVREQPYEEHIVPSGWYDLAIGNVPFGDYKVFDKIYNHLSPNIHDYFFLKSLDQVRDGGLQILITSSFSMDKTSDRIRDRISKEGVLVGALRFPNNTFQKNAGTEVVTDLLLIRKKTSTERQQDAKNSEKYEIAKANYDLALKAISKCENAIKKAKTKPKLAELNYNLKELKAALVPVEKIFKAENEAYQTSRPDWMKTVTIPDPDGGEPIKINKYFAENPEMILGEVKRTGTMYGSDSITVEPTEDFEERLSRAVSLLPENVAKPRTEVLDDSILDRIIVDETIRHGAVRIDGGKLLRAEGQPYGGVIFREDVSATPAQIRRTERMLEILDASRRVINADLAKDSQSSVDEKRRELNLVYDRFVRDFGALNLKKNQELLEGDPDLPRLLAIENYDSKTKKAEKTDIFEKPTVRHYEQPLKARDLGDALGITLNEYGRIYLPRIMFLLKQDNEAIEQTYLRVQKEFVDTGVAFLDPASDEWTMREEYLAGNVRERLSMAKLAAESEPERYSTNVTELEKVIPVDLTFDQIDVELGASWLEKDDVANFLAYLTGGETEDFVVAHSERSGFWAVDYTARGYSHREKSTTTEIWGTGRCNMIEAVQHLCDGRNIIIKDRDYQNGNVVYVTNVEETEAANQKAAEIQDEFKDWIWQDETRRNRLVRKYNDLYNSFLPVQYDGSHLTFPGMATEIDGKPFALRANQVNAIWRGIREGKGLMAHPVGSGKTYLEIALAMKMKQMGLTNKPCLGFLKKNIKQAVADARKLYPHANILTTDGNFDSKKRKATVSRIATGNYDLVIMTHDHIDMLPMRPETRALHIHEQLDELNEVMAVAKHLSKTSEGSRAESRLHSRLEKAKENLEVRLKETLGKSKDDAIYFEETGIDLLKVDEFQYYKALQVITVKTGIKGIPTSYSERAINMYARFQWLQQTQNGRNTFAATGTPITNSMAELYNLQKYFQKQTLEERGIIAFDAWMHLFGRTVSKMERTATGTYKNVERLCEFTNLPELVAISGQFMDIYLAEEMPELNRPIVDVEVIKSQMTDAQRGFILELQERAKNLKYGGEDNMLAISTDARKVSLDPRLVMSGIEDEDEYKVNQLITQLLAVRQMDGIRTQMIFSEMGIHDVVFDDIVKKLVASGVPRDKIINFSTMTDKEAESAVPRLRSGDALFGLGSTKTLGTGVNAQDNLFAIHNLDTHWLPAYDKQRRGRLERNGNRFYFTGEHVKSYYYITEGGFDEIMYAANHRKQEFIDQIMRAKGDPAKVLHRKIQEVDTEEITYAQLAAVASGNPKILVQLELDKEVKSLLNQERRHNTSQIRLKGDYASSKRSIADFERMEAKFTADYELWTRETERIASRAELNRETNQKAKDAYNDTLDLMKISVHEKKLSKADFETTKTLLKNQLDAAQLPENEFEIELGGLRFNNRAEAGEKLSQMVNAHILHDTVIGAYKGFKVIAQVEYRQDVRAIGLVLQSPSNTKYSVNYWTEEGVFRSMEHLSTKLPEYIDEQQKSRKLAEVNITKIEAEIGKPFKYAERLREAKNELADVEFEISIFSLPPEEQAEKIAEREAKKSEIKVLPESFVTAEESGYFNKAKEVVSDAVNIFRGNLPEGTLAKPAEFVNSAYHAEAETLRDEPLSNYWYKMRFGAVGKGKLGINPAAYALVQRAYSETDRGGAFEFAGMYNDPETVKSLTDVLRNQAKINVSYKSVLNEFADKIEEVAAHRDGTLAFIADERAMTHEGFHADSYVAAAGKTLEARHSRLDQLVEHEAFEQATKEMTREYRTDNPAMQVEELANLFAEALDNKAEDAEMPYNLTREQCESYLDLWFTSFAEANGDMSREKFEELNESAREIRDVAYNRINHARTPESPEFARASEELGEISSEEKRNKFFKRLHDSQLKRDITDDLIKRQGAVKPEFSPKESIGEKLGEIIVLDEKLKDVEYKLEKLNGEKQSKIVSIEVEGEYVSTSLEKLREERNQLADEALQAKIKTGYFKLNNGNGKKSEKSLQFEFLNEQKDSLDKLQKPLVSKVFSALNKEIKPLEGEAENLRKNLSIKRADTDKYIDGKIDRQELIPSPAIKPDTLWALQENAIKRQDLESFEMLEKIHRLSGLPRSPRAASRIAALQVMTGITATNQHHEFATWADNAKNTTRVRIMVENKEGKLVPSNWDSDRLRDEQRRFEEKSERTKNRAVETRRASFKRLLDPISNKINPVSNVQGSLSWLTDPSGTFNAHFNPLQVLKNDPAVQLCRAGINFVRKQGEARLLEAQAAEVLRDGGKFIKEKEIALEGEIEKQFVTRKAEVKTAEEMFKAVSESHIKEIELRTELVENGANAELLAPPKETFLKEELSEVGRASVQYGDAEYLKIYEKAVSKPGIAEVLGEGTERVAARVILSHAETAAVARNAVETVAQFEDSVAGAVELSPTKLLEVERHLEASEIAEAWLTRLDPENVAKPVFTEQELVRLDTLKYGMDTNSVSSVDALVGTNKIDITPVNLTDQMLSNPDYVAEIAAQTKPILNLTEMSKIVKGDALTNVLQQQSAANAQNIAQTSSEVINPAIKVTEETSRIDDSKQFWDKLRQQQDERLGFQRIENNLEIEAQQLSEQMAMEAVETAEAAEGVGAIVAAL